jgi:bacterioferritin (cytochrome b1)
MRNRVAYSPESEGAFSAPIDQIITSLGRLLSLKYATDIAYRSFADRLRGPWRDALVEHWQEHAKDERDATYDIAMKIMALGADPMVVSIAVKPANSSIGAFCDALKEIEYELISEARKICEMAGENRSLSLLMEEVILKDGHHLDDLHRTCSEMAC